MGRLVAVALAALVSSCTRERAAAPSRVLEVAARVQGDAGASAPVIPPAPADVRVAFFGDEGAFLGPFYEPLPDAAVLVRPCFERARALERAVSGFILFDVVLTQDGPAKITTREASPLPASLVECASAALVALRPPDRWFVPPPSTLYVSLR